jgi:cell division protease FtsH
MSRKRWLTFAYALFAIWAVLTLRGMWLETQRVSVVSYSEFRDLLQKNRVSEIVVYPDHIRGKLRAPEAGKPSEFTTVRVDPEFARELGQFDVQYSGAVPSDTLRQVLSWTVPTLLFLAIWFFVIRSVIERQTGAGGLLTIGKSKARIYIETDTKVTFADVAGVDEAKEELQEIVGFLKDPAKYGRLGARIPKGVLLVGPPGTGKTLLARAVAGEAGVPFFSISGSEFVEMFVGVGAARVRDLFQQARQHAPAIIFIDELDALGRARGAFGIGGHDEKEQTLNQLLAELDGFDPRQGLVLLAATNRPEILDTALLRPGRFDRQILVDRPDKIGRVQILRVHIKRVRAAPELVLEDVAALTPGFTGADLANLVNEAALAATRRGAVEVQMADFMTAFERILAGLEKKNRLLNPLERRIVAHHEMGHALVAMSLPGSDTVHKVSIIPRGIGSVGHTVQRPTEDRFLMTRAELQNKMAVLLAGRAAENLVFGEISTGAADDLDRATQIARAMATRYGMVDQLGGVSYDAERALYLKIPELPEQPRAVSDATAREIDCAVRELVEAAQTRALGILEGRRADLESGAALLLQKETLGEADLAIYAQQRAKPLAPAA